MRLGHCLQQRLLEVQPPPLTLALAPATIVARRLWVFLRGVAYGEGPEVEYPGLLVEGPGLLVRLVLGPPELL